MNESFIIYALPRSRTAWLSTLLSINGWVCAHERAITLREPADIPALFNRPRFGCAETAAAQGHWLIEHYVPRIRRVVVRRPVEEVVRSMLALDIQETEFHYDEKLLRRNMVYGARMLEQIAHQPGTLVIDYRELDCMEHVARLFEFCIHQPLSVVWWDIMKNHNVQVDVKSALRYYHDNREGVEGFKRKCKRELRRLCRLGLVRKEAA